MREILFKAKRIDNDEWVEGYYSKSPDPMFAFLKDFIFAPYFDEKTECGHDNGYKIDIDTLCQYTGLTDMFGNKIWENDIIKEHCNGLVGRLIWDVPTATYKLEGFGNDYKIEDAHIEWEVSGNIFDNPELLGM